MRYQHMTETSYKWKIYFPDEWDIYRRMKYLQTNERSTDEWEIYKRMIGLQTNNRST